jgi:protein-arginine kinase activator protein McsA
MPYKDPEVRKKYHKLRSHEHYLKTQEETKQRTKENKTQLRAEWSAFKASLKCTTCGENHPAALDFHHIDPSTKDREVSWFLKNSQFTKAIEEATKCVVLCANCHRKHHWQEKKKPTL